MLLSAVNIFGQTQNVDSLVNLLHTKKLTTDEQLELYQNICQYYFTAYDSDKTQEYAEKGLALSKKTKNDLKSAVFNEYIGYAYKDRMNYDTAYIYFERGLELAVKASNIEQQVSAYLDIGAYYGDKEMWDLAYEQFLKALPLSESLEDKTKYISILGNIGSTHRILDNLDKAIHYFELMKEAAEKNNNLPHKRKAYYELGTLHKDKMEYDKSLEYLQSALDISRNTGSKIYEIVCLQMLAQVYSKDEIKDYEKAVQYAKESLSLSESMVNPLVPAVSWGVLSVVYLRQGKYNESLDASYKSMACDTANMKNTIALYTNLTDAYLAIGNSDSAAVYFHKYSYLKDKYITKELQESIAKMETEYETEKKELRIASLEKERRLYIWLGIFGALLAFALGIVLWQTKRNARKEKQLIATRSVLDGEMRERTRLAQDLHDRLSGNLSAMKIELDNQAESLQNIRNKLDTCIRDIRDAAHDIMPSSLQFGMKVALKDFAAQFPNVRFHFFGKENRIDERTEYVVYCCANELVNNSVKHSGAKNIDLQLVQDDKYVTLTVSDDGCGFDEKTVTKGLGLESIRNRVASCNGKIDIAASPDKGTETTIELRVEN